MDFKTWQSRYCARPDTEGGKGTGLGEFMGKENDYISSARSALFGL